MELLGEFLWGVVGSEFFAVPVPELDVVPGEDFYEAAAVVVFELWLPSHF